jgi:NADH-quinone oxidoreductase subunit G
MSAEMKPKVEMVNIEVDGIALQAPKGSMIIEATDKAGIEIPRFCYHPKLSIAANCRMCLVDVEKAPKPLPACATPVMEGMKVYTDSRRAVDAQHGVMEFLLINHPLDCPICDQGGECELQDQAMGYGRSVARFTERKRVVKDKNVGPLVQTEMTRCIHCTRCVRFLEEIAGTAEMGGAGRGDRLEIGTCVENSIDSELSGNIIDLCPVGALTNKPFRFAARAWELVARPSVAAHDAVGSCLFHHVRRGKILRTVPRDNEATNEAWLSDRDRYSHLGLYARDRVLSPQLRQDGEWKEVRWDEAFNAAAAILKEQLEQHGPQQLGLLMSPSCTNEEFYLAQHLVRQLGSGNIDHRLREQDFSDDAAGPVSAAFTMKTAEIQDADAVLLVGCNPRQEAPIIGHRLRKAHLGGAKITAINPVDWPFHFDTSLDAIVAPQKMVGELAALAVAVEKATGVKAGESLQPVLQSAADSARHDELARRLQEGGRSLVMLGQFAMTHPDAAWLRKLAGYVAEATGSSLNVLRLGGNPVGARQAGAVPHHGPGGAKAVAGRDTADMLNNGLSCAILWDIEPEFDIDDPARTMKALGKADKVIAVGAFATDSLKAVADVILPLSPLAESEGSILNFDGDGLQFGAAGTAMGESRPGWKILRMLGHKLGLDGFGQVSLAEVQQEAVQAMTPIGRSTADTALRAPVYAEGLYRIGELPMYSVDALVRRSGPLQQTAQAQVHYLGLSREDADRLGLNDGAVARVRQGDASAEIEVRVTDEVPAGGAWLRTATCAVRELGPAVAPIVVEVADA